MGREIIEPKSIKIEIDSKLTLIRTQQPLSPEQDIQRTQTVFRLDENKMKLQLLITRRETKHYNTTIKVKHFFAVIDLDKSKQYPQNFVSVLPKSIKAGDKPSNKFEELFGNQSLEMANQLLKKALKTRPDSETATAIRDRIKLLNPQPHNKTKCEKCGKPIKQSKRKYRPYKFCFECHSKRYLKK